MVVLKYAVCVVIVFGFARVQGETQTREPHVGYLYPAGGRQGTTIQITAGGQFLRGVTDVYVSGEGVEAKVVKYEGQLKKLNQEQRGELQNRLKLLRQKRTAVMPGKNRPAAPLKAVKKTADPNAAVPPETEAKPVELPNHPLLRNLDKLSPEGLDKVMAEFIRPNLNQINPQISETVLIEITLAPDAAPGEREIRLVSPLGLTNPMRFEIGTLPEIREPEYADPGKPHITPAETPVVLNGQILPGEVDRFRFRAVKGQRLVIDAHARRLIPYLGDAVPGWFQATLKLSDAGGKEAAYADDFYFDPDPVLYYEILRDGEYVLEINDSIYRGREDFVYRVTVAQRPFITRVFPLGAPAGKTAAVSVDGWNLSGRQIELDTQPGETIRRMAITQDGLRSNEIAYAVDMLPECGEAENNDTSTTAQKIGLPQIVNGRIEKPGDVDVFRFDGRAGDEVVAEVYARRLNSPLDSQLHLTDATGKELIMNDDCEDKESGLLTHYADSYLRYKLPQDGVYTVLLTDTQHHGGDDYGYRLRLGPPRPDFSVYVYPSSLAMQAGRTTPIHVQVFRKEGFEGDIELALKDAPAGFVLGGGKIPAGRSTIRMTLTAPPTALHPPASIQFEGRSQIDGQVVRRRAVPSEDAMQAFIYRHFVPSQELRVVVSGGRRKVPSVQWTDTKPLRVPAGDSAKVFIKVPPLPAMRNIQLKLNEPPDGITLEDVAMEPEGRSFLIKTDAQKTKAGFIDNLIVEVWGETPPQGQGKGAGAAKEKQQVFFGVLPAIPIEILGK